jgi:Uma2 family endonuclease
MVATTKTKLEEQVVELVRLLVARPITEEIAQRVEEYNDFKLLEITNGNWILEPEEWTADMTGEEHGWIEALLMHAFMNYVLKHGGRVYPGDTDFVLDGEPGDVRIKRKPDVAFVAAEHVQSTRGYYFRAPDLAIEIVSPSQRHAQMLPKVAEYLLYGSSQVWLVFPSRKEVEVHTADAPAQVYGMGDVISGGELLPEFTLEVAALFEA